MAPLAAVLLVLLIVTPAAALDVTTCGQVVPPGEAGVLLNDLDCSGEPVGSDGVTLGRKSSLDLQGYTIIGPTWTNEAQNAAVRCRFGEVTCRVQTNGRAKCRYPGGTCSVSSSTGTALLTGLSAGVYSGRNLHVENVRIETQSIAVWLPGKLVATDVTIDGSGGGIFAAKMTLTDVSISNTNDFGIFSEIGDVRGTNVTVSGNARGGIRAGKVKITGLTATGNGTGPALVIGGGVHAGHVILTDSVVTGNTFGGEPLDIAAGSRPKLFNTACGTSQNYRSSAGESWGVCTND